MGPVRSTRSATGAEGSGPWAGVAAPFWRADGRGIDGPPPVSASLYGLRPQTALRRTIDPSPSGVLSGAEHRPPGLGGGFGGVAGWRFARLRRRTAPSGRPLPPPPSMSWEQPNAPRHGPALLPYFPVDRLLGEPTVSLLHDGSVGPFIVAPRLRGAFVGRWE